MLHALHTRWLAAILDGPVPDEPRATCHACAMVPTPDDPPARSQRVFDAALKCCTYHPTLANFLAGGILSGPPSAARDHLEQRIAAGISVTPFGVWCPPDYPEGLRFGVDPALRCPFLDDGGGCGIWAHRNGTCATYFCRFEAGVRGATFWGWTRLTLENIEKSLARHLAVELGAALDPVDWGAWSGREADFFRAAADRAATVSGARALALGGLEVAVLARSTREAYQSLSRPVMPAILVPARVDVLRAGATTTRLVGYRATDPIDLPNALVDALAGFDGVRDVAGARAWASERDPGVEMDDATVRRLVDFQVLVPASSLVRRRND